MKTTKSRKKETIGDIRELIIKHEGYVKRNPEVQMYHATLASLNRRLVERMDQGVIEFSTLKDADWWENARLMYPIRENDDGTYTVVSEAANWTEEKLNGPYSHKYEALEKIDQLMGFKNNDRNRGIGDRDADIERVAPMVFIQTGRLPQGYKAPQRQKIMVQGITQKAVKTIKEKLIVALPEATPAVAQLRA